MFARMIACYFIVMLLGCAAYHAPGGPADFRALGITPEAQKAGTGSDIQAAFDKKPLAGFPAGIAVVRIQAPGYQSYTASGWGSGAYSIVTTRDVEPEEAYDKLRKLPGVRGIAPVNRLLLPSQLNSDRELRDAAAKLQADMLLVYTLDTSFRDRDLATPVSVITLGLAPTKATNVVTTASAVLMDTRNGYVYGVAEASAKRSGLATSWNTSDAIDGDRKRTEEEAFAKMADELQVMWKGVYGELGPNSPRGGGRYETGK